MGSVDVVLSAMPAFALESEVESSAQTVHEGTIALMDGAAKLVLCGLQQGRELARALGDEGSDVGAIGLGEPNEPSELAQ